MGFFSPIRSRKDKKFFLLFPFTPHGLFFADSFAEIRKKFFLRFPFTPHGLFFMDSFATDRAAVEKAAFIGKKKSSGKPRTIGQKKAHVS